MLYKDIEETRTGRLSGGGLGGEGKYGRDK